MQKNIEREKVRTSEKRMGKIPFQGQRPTGGNGIDALINQLKQNCIHDNVMTIKKDS